MMAQSGTANGKGTGDADIRSLIEDSVKASLDLKPQTGMTLEPAGENT